MTAKAAAEGFVLAGGKSSRMGRDKALVELGERPLIAWVLESLHEAGLTARIAGARSELAEFAPVIADRESNAGPLAGVCAALAGCDAKLAVFLSVDMPLVPGELIAYLARDAAATGRMVTLASVDEFPQTFPAVVRREALGALEDELRNGSAGCFAGFQTAAARAGEQVRVIRAEELAQAGQIVHPLSMEPGRWFHNVNSPAELERAEQWLRSQVPKSGPGAPALS